MIAISKIKEIWICIFDSNIKSWRIIKHNEYNRPKNIAFLYFNNKYKNDLYNHYDAICLIDPSINEIETETKKLINENNNYTDDLKIKVKFLEDQVSKLNDIYYKYY